MLRVGQKRAIRKPLVRSSKGLPASPRQARRPFVQGLVERVKTGSPGGVRGGTRNLCTFACRPALTARGLQDRDNTSVDTGPIAQLVEPPAHNRSVPGSSPGGSTSVFRRPYGVLSCGCPRFQGGARRIPRRACPLPQRAAKNTPGSGTSWLLVCVWRSWRAWGAFYGLSAPRPLWRGIRDASSGASWLCFPLPPDSGVIRPDDALRNTVGGDVM